ncbi:MAG: hypothetical protein R2827_00770 [Bdellovibrionales bacterium]
MGDIKIADIVDQWEDKELHESLNWKGTFDDYLALIKENPMITRNAFQRMYDMVIEAGTESYIDAKRGSLDTNFLMMKSTAAKMLF